MNLEIWFTVISCYETLTASDYFVHNLIYSLCRDRSSPEGKARSPPLSASMFSSFPFVTHTFVIPKTAGLGVILGGGEGKPDGPHIFIDKILDGMDAKKVSHKLAK